MSRERWQELDQAATPGPWLIGWNEARQADRDFCNAARDGWPAAERECEQLRALLQQVRDMIADEKPSWRDIAAGNALELIDESGLLDT